MVIRAVLGALLFAALALPAGADPAGLPSGPDGSPRLLAHHAGGAPAHPSSLLKAFWQPGFQVGVSASLTRAGSLQIDGAAVGNPRGQEVNEGVTRVELGYNLSQEAGVGLSLPYIHRSFRRVGSGGAPEEGTESGLGDLVLSGRYAPVRWFEEDSALVWSLSLGLELPTGDTGRLAEEAAEEEGHGHDQEEAPTSRDNAVHGHDLALGSGSVDGVVGSRLFFRSQGFFLSAGARYWVRSRGAFDYRYGDTLEWSLAPGLFVVDDPDAVLGLQLGASGEHSGRDDHAGRVEEGTGGTVVYLGPRIFGAAGEDFSARLAVDVPVSVEAQGLQTVPDFRVEAGLNWRL